MKMQLFPYSACFVLFVLGGCTMDLDLGVRINRDAGSDPPTESEDRDAMADAPEYADADADTPDVTAPTSLAGELDTTFGTDGRLMDVFGMSAVNVLVSADDHIFVVGNCPNSACIARLTPGGTIDPAYGDGGLASLTGMMSVDAVLLSDGRIVVGGYTYGKPGVSSIYSVVNTDGIGYSLWSLPNGSPQGAGTSNIMLAAQGNDVAIVFQDSTGYAHGVGPIKMMIAKLTDGFTDAAFGTNGITSATFVGEDRTYGSGVAIRPDGEIVIVGNASSPSVLQLNGSTGAPDRQFYLSYSGGPLVLLPDGRMVVTTHHYNSYSLDAYFADGAPDNTFELQLPGTSDEVEFPRAFLDHQNRLLVTTATNGTLESVSRVTTAGTFDTTFGVNGNAVLPLPAGLSSPSRSIAARVQKDGRIVVLSQAIKDSANVSVVSRLWN